MVPKASAMTDISYPEYAYSNTQAQWSHHYLERHIIRMCRQAGPIEQLLDAGCGNGALAQRLTRLANRVYAFDLSRTGVEQAERLLGPGRVRVASAYDDFSSLFPEVSRFDVITSVEVIEHLYAPRDFVRQARSALRPGGSLIITTPYHGYTKNLALALSGKLDAHFTALWDGGHIKFWSLRTLSTLLEELGFTVTNFEGAGRLPWLWKSMVVRAVRKD